MNKEIKEEKITLPELQEILIDYSNWLHKKGYIDSDYYCEEPKAVDAFLAEKYKIKIYPSFLLIETDGE